MQREVIMRKSNITCISRTNMKENPIFVLPAVYKQKVQNVKQICLRQLEIPQTLICCPQAVTNHEVLLQAPSNLCSNEHCSTSQEECTAIFKAPTHAISKLLSCSHNNSNDEQDANVP